MNEAINKEIKKALSLLYQASVLIDDARTSFEVVRAMLKEESNAGSRTTA